MQNGTEKSVSAAIVAYNSEGVILRAIASVPQSTEIVIVDNASNTPIRNFIDDERVRIIENSRNVGFGPACNIAARTAQTDYIFFLNPDAEIQGDALATLLRVANDMADRGGAFAPLLVGDEGVVPPRCGTMLDANGAEHISDLGADPRVVDFISGAAFLIERKLFLELGGFDENIFLYLEDDDLSLRLRRIGRPPVLVPGARVYHFEKNQAAVPFSLLFRKNYHTMRSFIYLSKKYDRPVKKLQMKLKSARRAIFAALRFDRVRIAKNLGRLAALYGLRMN